MKTRILKGCIFALLLAIALPIAHADPFMDWYKKIGEAQKTQGFPLPEEKIKELLEDAKPLIQQGSDDPRFYTQLAEFVRELHGYYYDRTYPFGKYAPNSPESQALIKKYSSYYRKALDLDDKPDAPAHLDHYMLTAMATDVLAAPDIKERAFKKKLTLNRQGKVLHENQEWGTYEFLLGEYAKQKDYDKYLKTVNEMIERFPNHPRMNELLEYKRQAGAAIEKRGREVTLEGNKLDGGR